MNAERVGRFELTLVWRRKLEELRQQGECTQHLEAFLAQVERLPGENVSDLAYAWCAHQANRRPVISLAWLLLVSLAVWLTFVGLGPALGLPLVVASASLGLGHLHRLWASDLEFQRELHMRATYALTHPCWTRA